MAMTQHYRTKHCGYGAGHPWYYLLGGAVLSPKQIRDNVRQSGYRGYLLDEITAAGNKPEPQRSRALRQLHTRAVEAFRQDMSGYRRCALQLHRYRAANPMDVCPTRCDNIHTAIGLKHNHLVNDLAHLITIDAMLTVQADLFGF